MTAPLGLAALTVLDTAPLAHIGLAEKCGYDTVGFRLLPAAPGTTAYPLHEEPARLREVKARLADSPVRVFDIEIVRIGADFDVNRYSAFLEASADLGARAILVGGDDREIARLAENYARFAESCAPLGLAASLEFMPWTAVPDARAAVEIVRQADGPSRSVLVDTLHVARSTTTLDDLRAIPADWIHYAQLCDGTVPTPQSDEELIHDARQHRLVPCEGGINLAEIWACLPPETPVSVELPNERQRRAMGTEAWLDHLVNASGTVLDQAASHRMRRTDVVRAVADHPNE